MKKILVLSIGLLLFSIQSLAMEKEASVSCITREIKFWTGKDHRGKTRTTTYIVSNGYAPITDLNLHKGNASFSESMFLERHQPLVKGMLPPTAYVTVRDGSILPIEIEYTLPGKDFKFKYTKKDNQSFKYTDEEGKVVHRSTILKIGDRTFDHACVIVPGLTEPYRDRMAKIEAQSGRKSKIEVENTIQEGAF